MARGYVHAVPHLQYCRWSRDSGSHLHLTSTCFFPATAHRAANGTADTKYPLPCPAIVLRRACVPRQEQARRRQLQGAKRIGQPRPRIQAATTTPTPNIRLAVPLAPCVHHPPSILMYVRVPLPLPPSSATPPPPFPLPGSTTHRGSQSAKERPTPIPRQSDWRHQSQGLGMLQYMAPPAWMFRVPSVACCFPPCALSGEGHAVPEATPCRGPRCAPTN